MGDETDPCPRKASFGHMVEFFGIFPFRERASVLSQDTEVMWSADRSNVKFPFPGEFVNLEEGLLVLFRGQLKLFLDLHTAAYRHQEKGMQSGGTKFQGQAINGLKFMKVVLGERGIDLKGDTGVNKMQDPLNSLVKGARHLAKTVVCFPVGAVQADGNPPNARGSYFFRQGKVNHGPIGGQCHRDTFLISIPGDIEDIRANHRFASA